MREYRPVLSARGALVFAARGRWRDRECREGRLHIVATQQPHEHHDGHDRGGPQRGRGPDGHQIPEHVPRLSVAVEHVLETLDDVPTLVGPDGAYFYDLRIPAGAEPSLLPEGVAPGSDEAQAFAAEGWELEWVDAPVTPVSPYDPDGNDVHPDTALDWIPSSNELEVDALEPTGAHAVIAPVPGRVRCRQLVLAPARHRVALLCQLHKDGAAKARHAVGDVIEIEGRPLEAPLCLWGLREGPPIRLHPGAAAATLPLSVSAMPAVVGDPEINHFGLYGVILAGHPRLEAVVSTTLHPSFVCPPLAHFSDVEADP